MVPEVHGHRVQQTGLRFHALGDRDLYFSAISNPDVWAPASKGIMKNRYLRNRMIQIGLALVIFGWGPLWIIVLLAAIGLWPDPNPNPIGPGLLFFFTAWPVIICLAIGIFQVRRINRLERTGAKFFHYPEKTNTPRIT